MTEPALAAQHRGIWVVKRSGKRERVSFDKVCRRLESLSDGLSVDTDSLGQKVVGMLKPDIETKVIDRVAARTAHNWSLRHPDYDVLAARIAVTNLHKETIAPFSEVIRELYDNETNIGQDVGNHEQPDFVAKHWSEGDFDTHRPLVTKELFDFVTQNAAALNSIVDHERDFLCTYFGHMTHESRYSIIKNGRPYERRQHLLMRVATAVHMPNMKDIEEAYYWASLGFMTWATPTLFNAGSYLGQLASCFLMAMKKDSIAGIYETLRQVAAISKLAGGIGLWTHNIRAAGSLIRSVNRPADGIQPMLAPFNWTARYVDQGKKRKGAFAIYMEPHHADIMTFLEQKLPTGKIEVRNRDLHYALWISNLFMRRVVNNEQWSLMCPDRCRGLHDVHGEEYERLYQWYESKGMAKEQLPARKVWNKILHALAETGEPYMLFKDHVNFKCNQKNLGTIKSSNLCAEITEFSSADETAVCNLASIALPKFLIYEEAQGHSSVNSGLVWQTACVATGFDFETLRKVAYFTAKSLNNVIDRNLYPTDETKRSNMRHRPVGIGVQGLAEVFIGFRIPFDSPRARELNKHIFETIYFGAMQASMDMARRDGPYESFQGSPLSQGKFQFDLWNEYQATCPDMRGMAKPVELSGMWDWDALRKDVMQHGVRNSLLIALMPTASTSQLLGNHECFEPYTQNVYARQTPSGTFKVFNKAMVADLKRLGMWTPETRANIKTNNGSIQHLPDSPDEEIQMQLEHIKEVYRTVYEIPQKSIVDMAADRGVFVCQSQSMNLYIKNPDVGRLSSMLVYAWKKGLKTGVYYLRTGATKNAKKTTVSIENKEIPTKPTVEAKEDTRTPSANISDNDESDDNDSDSDDGPVCTMEDGCLSCGA